MDAVLVAQPQDRELSRSTGQGAASNVLDIGEAQRVNIYGVCLPADGKRATAPRLTVTDGTGAEVDMVCDGVVARTQLVDAMRGNVSVKASADTLWSLLLAAPPGT